MSGSAISVRFRLFAAFGFIAITLWAAIAFALQAAQSRAIAQANAEGRNLAHSLAEHMASSVRAIDLSLRHLRDDWIRDPGSFAAAVVRHQEMLKDVAIDQVLVLGKNGRTAYGSLPTWQPLDASDRPYFNVHKQRATDELDISEPVLGRVTGKWTIRFTRPIHDRHGQFAGVLVFSVPPPALERIYKDIALGEGGAITLVRSDGQILARSENLEQAANVSIGDVPGLSPADAPAGEFRRVSRIDGVERFYQYRKIPRYPLILYVGQAVDTVLAPYYAQRKIYQASGALATALLAAFMLLLIFRLTERAVAQQALQESQARLANIIDSAMDAIITVDETYTILVFNRAAETMFRCNAADALGQSLDRFIPQRFHAAHHNHMGTFGATGVGARTMGQPRTVVGLRADGGEFPFEAAISQVMVGGRRLFTVMLRDIVGRIAAAEKQRDVLVREVHHRINNNLQGIIGLMQQHAAAHPELNDLVERMAGQIRAVALVHGLGGASVPGEIGLRALIADISQAAAARAQIEVLVDGAVDAAPIRIARGEAVPVALLLNELLFNAIKHGAAKTTSGNIRIMVSEHDHLVRVRISNPGALPAPDFDFAGGVGLGSGLTLIKALLPRHGAKLEIVQEGGQVLADLTLTDPAIIWSS